ncbi:hypothetical protein K6Q96_03815 [Grimontia kaedaensis]|uniref:Uncharacterized protein n=1 Tax=Grimontia kaedaensis TaxID=2872157 RepID=A0ABY4WU93_9GAMM|nr:hypothetical protein [Grimontia kaedaensis]USH03151.1 hypothetical protein K6Q96_03815 [Grimontia kaedaensis]
MKKLLSIIAVVGLTSTISMSANATSWATQAGPLVMCEKSNGEVEYIPTLLCRTSGGSFDKNLTNQW